MAKLHFINSQYKKGNYIAAIPFVTQNFESSNFKHSLNFMNSLKKHHFKLI